MILIDCACSSIIKSNRIHHRLARGITNWLGVYKEFAWQGRLISESIDIIDWRETVSHQSLNMGTLTDMAALEILWILLLATSCLSTKLNQYFGYVQDKDIWPTWIYQNVSFTRKPHVGYCIENNRFKAEQKQNSYFLLTHQRSKL